MTIVYVAHRYDTSQPFGRICGPDNRQLTPAEVAGLAALYFPADQIANAVAIARCESGFWTGAWATDGEDSRGLWQINVAAGAHPELAHYNLFDPQINSYFAYQIYSEAGGWSPWSCAKTLGL